MAADYELDMNYECEHCRYLYEPRKGDPAFGIAPGTSFNELPDDWVCPVCHEGKKQFFYKR